MITILNRAILAVLIASIITCGIIANDYENQKSANAAKLASAISEARQAERSSAQSRDVQKAVLEEKIHALMPTLPRTALDEFKQPAIMRVSAHKVR